MSNKRGLSEVAPNVASLGSAQASAKKQRKKPVTAKSLGLTKDEFDSIKPAPIRKELKGFAKKLGQQVDDDWHNGYEEQAETKGEWFEALQGPLQAVLDIGVGKGKALSQCNEVLKIVSDSYYDLLACPCRCNTPEDLSEMDKEFDLDLPWGGTFEAKSGSQYDVWSYVWVALLRVHSSQKDADETLLLRCIKDASDNMTGAYLMELPGVLYDQNADDFDEAKDKIKDGKDVPNGNKLAKLVKENASVWKGLPTTKETHLMRHAIDRRFDGSPGRRTRDYHLYDSDGEGYGGDEGDQCVIS